MNILFMIFSLFIKIARLLGVGFDEIGKVLLVLYPSAFNLLCEKFKIVLIEGTNGKSTTSEILKSILYCDGVKACVAKASLNTKETVTAFLAENYKCSIAVFSADSEALKSLLENVSPEIIAVTNLYSDITDTYENPDKTKELLAEAYRHSENSTLILNGDTTVFWDFLPSYEKIYYGIKEIPSGFSKSENLCCPMCQAEIVSGEDFSYACSVCGIKRPTLDVYISKIFEITHNFSRICFNDGMQVSLPLSGIYNIYNALCAAACAKKLGVSKHSIEEALSGLERSIDGTQTIIVDGVEVVMMPVKNAAGANESIHSVIPDREPSNLAFILNDDEKDGIDVSWIYNVRYEAAKEMNYNNILIAGNRRYDMAVRLKTAGLNTSAFFMCADYEALLYDIKMHCHDRIYLFTTYSGMQNFRKFLRRKKY